MLSRLLLLLGYLKVPLLISQRLLHIFSVPGFRLNHIYELMTVMCMEAIAIFHRNLMSRSILRQLRTCRLQICSLTLSICYCRPPVLGQLGTQQLVIIEESILLPIRTALTDTGATQTATDTRILRYG